jgi:succinate-acetate transporter protein
MTEKYANASTLGYAGFALTLWMVSMLNAGWFGRSASASHMDLLLALAFGGGAMGLAGLLEYFKGHTTNMLLFLGFGAFWCAWAVHAHDLGTAMMSPSAGGYMGWFFLVWAVFAFYIWLASMHAGVMRNLFALGVWLTLLALAIADWSGIAGFTILSGYLGLISALIGGYVSAADTINASAGHAVLPTGSASMPAVVADPAHAHA